MAITSREHDELMKMFEKEFRHHRLDREEKTQWAKGNVYQNGMTNELFLAYRRGVAYGQAVSA